jgi:ribosome-associated protein
VRIAHGMPVGVSRLGLAAVARSPPANPTPKPWPRMQRRARVRYSEVCNPMIYITEHIVLSEDELQETFIRSSGPGGQHVNKTSTGVQLRFDVANSASLPEGVRARLLARADSRLTEDGILVITATSQRSQKGNREEALERLVQLIRAAATPPRPRHKTRPSRAAKARRLDGKRRRGEIKAMRGPVRND